MRRWLTLGAVVLLAVWAPFLYAELTSERVEKDGPVATDPFEHDPMDETELAAAQAEAPAAEEGSEAEEEAEGAEEEGADPALERAAEEEDPAEGERTEVAEAPAEPGPEAVEGQDEEGETAEGEDKPAAKPPQGTTQASAVLRRAFENEPRDALWAREAEASLLQIFSQAEFPGSAIRGTRCQKTVCKLELTWTSELADAYMMAFQRVQAKFGSQLGVETAGQGTYDDEMRIDLYVPREGYTLADLAR